MLAGEVSLAEQSRARVVQEKDRLLLMMGWYGLSLSLVFQHSNRDSENPSNLDFQFLINA